MKTNLAHQIRVAQWIAHQTSNLGVVSSSLIADATNFLKKYDEKDLDTSNIFEKIFCAKQPTN